MPKLPRTPYHVEASPKGVYDPQDLVDLGFGRLTLIYQLLKEQKIPGDQIGSNWKIPGSWVHERL
jgi:hypothetical protein